MSVNAVFPGTFNPFTIGHFEVLKKALDLFESVTVLVADNPEKVTAYPIAERITQLEGICEKYSLSFKVDTLPIGTLLVDYVKKHHINVIVRGVRHGADFEFEWPMAQMNAQLAPNCHTVFLLPRPEHMHISSTLVRQIAAAGKNIESFLP